MLLSPMRYLSSISLALIVLMALACTAEPTPEPFGEDDAIAMVRSHLSATYPLVFEPPPLVHTLDTQQTCLDLLEAHQESPMRADVMDNGLYKGFAWKVHWKIDKYFDEGLPEGSSTHHYTWFLWPGDMYLAKDRKAEEELRELGVTDPYVRKEVKSWNEDVVYERSNRLDRWDEDFFFGNQFESASSAIWLESDMPTGRYLAPKSATQPFDPKWGSACPRRIKATWRTSELQRICNKPNGYPNPEGLPGCAGVVGK